MGFAPDGSALALHREACTESKCTYPVAGQYFTVGHERFTGCPVAAVRGEARRWILAHAEFKALGGTPAQLGVCGALELEPRYYDALMVVDTQIRLEEAARAKPATAPPARA